MSESGRTTKAKVAPSSKRKHIGRAAGTPNKATAEVKLIAREYGADAIAKLWTIAKDSVSDSAKVSAIKEILDRGYGKAPQGLTIEGSMTLKHEDALSELE